MEHIQDTVNEHSTSPPPDGTPASTSCPTGTGATNPSAHAEKVCIPGQPLAIDCTDQALHLLQLDTEGSPALWRTAELQSGVVVEGVIQDRQAFTSALNALTAPCVDAGLTDADSHMIVFCVPEPQTYVHTCILPQAPDTVTFEVVSQELLGVLPFGSEELLIDYRVQSTAQGSEIYCVAVQKTVLDAYLGAFQKRNLTTLFVDVEMSALGRSLLPDDRSIASIVVDSGMHATSIALFRGTELLRTMYMPVGGENFTDIVLQVYPELTRAEAVQLKRTVGLSGSDAKLHSALRENLSVFLENLSLVLEEAVSLGIGSLGEVYIIGSCAHLPGFAEFIQLESGIITKIGNPVRYFSAHTPYTKLDTRYATVLGLALRTSRAPHTGFDLLRHYKAKPVLKGPSLIERHLHLLAMAKRTQRFVYVGILVVVLGVLFTIFEYIEHAFDFDEHWHRIECTFIDCA
jgi:Tfp pilus assembly PilM family ATPase